MVVLESAGLLKESRSRVRGTRSRGTMSTHRLTRGGGATDELGIATPPPAPNTLPLCRPLLPQEGGTEPTSQLLDLGGCSSLDLAPFISEKESGNISGFQIVGGGGARARLLGFKPQPCLFSPRDFGRVAEVRVSSRV